MHKLRAGRQPDCQLALSPIGILCEVTEYGYALNTLTVDRIVAAMNSAHGKPTRDKVPFDFGPSPPSDYVRVASRHVR